MIDSLGPHSESFRVILHTSMLSDEMSTEKGNETPVFRPSQPVMKPGAHLANPVRALDN